MKSEKRDLVPRLRFPEFQDAGEWKAKLLGDCLDYIQPTKYLVSSTDYDDKYPTPVLTAGKTFVLGYTNETKGIFDKNLPVIIFDDFTTASKFVDFPFKGKSSAMKILLAKKGVDIKFIYEAMQLIRYEVGVHERHWISIFSKLSVSVPTHFEEQQKIADCLSSIDALIAAQADKIDTLKTYKKGLMQRLFPREGESVPRLRFPEFRDAGGWEEQILGELVEIASGQVDPTDPMYCDKPHVGGENIESHTGRLQGMRTAKELGLISGKYSFDGRDILYSKIRPALNKVATPDFEGICSADIYPIRPSSQQLCRQYLAYLLLSDGFLKYATKNSGRSKIPKVNRESLLAYVLVIPVREEQQCIADCLTSLDALIDAHTEKLGALNAHKKGLMQQLFPCLEAACE